MRKSTWVTIVVAVVAAIVATVLLWNPLIAMGFSHGAFGALLVVFYMLGVYMNATAVGMAFGFFFFLRESREGLEDFEKQIEREQRRMELGVDE